MRRQPLDLSQHLQSVQKRQVRRFVHLPLSILLIATPLVIWGGLFVAGRVALAGIPASVVGKCIVDPIALGAFLDRDGKRLHARLEELDVEREMKNFHRSRIPDELELDVYIHQLMYNWTGYVGTNYKVRPDGLLVLTRAGHKRLMLELDQKIR